MKVIQGTFRPDRAESNDRPQFEPLTELPEPPLWLGAEGIVMYYENGRILLGYGVLTVPDLPAFLHMCALHDRIVGSYSAGELPPGMAITQFRVYCAEFGLTPASRTKVKANVPEKSANRFDANRRRA